jgi:2',3'-cyclic-nucleotide 2'-phosphodiesterase (5'-nucleotidase family)
MLPAFLLNRCMLVLAVSISMVLVALMPAAAKASEAAGAAGVKKLVLLHTSDEHSFNLGVGPESEDYPPSPVPGGVVYLKGGLARKSTIIKQLRAAAKARGAAVLTFSSGDNLMGTLSHLASETVSPDFTSLRDIGYSATTFGNHDFEVGPQFLGRTLQEALKKGNLQALYRELQPVVDRLRNREKVDIVVLLAHAGMDPEDWKKGESHQIAENVTGIDVILSGHTHLMAPLVIARNKQTGREVIITEPGCCNQYVSEIALTVGKGGKVRFDAMNSLVVPVTNAVSADPAMQGIVDATIRQLETVEDAPGRGSVLSRVLSDIAGKPVRHDGRTGSLYFHSFGRTHFDVFHDQIRAAESPMMRLVTDAMLAQARRKNPDAEMSMAGIGYVRDGIWKGQKGLISLADIFRSLPLGISPEEGTLGHPLTLVGLKREHLKLLLEFTPSMAFTSGIYSDLYTTTAGICTEVDTARQPWDRVTKIRYAARDDNDRCDGAVIYDVSADGWQPGFDERKVFTAALDYYHILFGFAPANISLLKTDGTPAGKPSDVILHWPNGNDMKTYQALAAYIQALSSAPGNQGYLPDRYADLLPRRIACSGPLCGKDLNPVAQNK